MKKTLFVLTLATIASPALAEFPVGKVGVSVSPRSTFELDGIPDGDGNAVGAYAEFGSSSLFAYGDILRTGVDVRGVDIDIDETRVGVGARTDIDRATLDVRVERYDIELDIVGTDVSDDGVGVLFGGALALTPEVSIFAHYGFLSLDDLDGDEIRLGISGKLSDSAELYGAWRKVTLEDSANDEADLTDLRLGVNLLF